MRYLALASDYDGTLARNGTVSAETVVALERWRESDRKLILVTGRELEDLMGIFPQINLFDRIVLENGALLYHPATGEEKLLGDRPPEAFIKSLNEKNVNPLSVGRVIVATWRPHDTAVMETIRAQGLNLQVIFNKAAVMILPFGIDKASGLDAALKEVGIK